MVRRILDGRDPSVPPLATCFSVLVVGPCGDMLGGSIHTFWSLRVLLVLFLLSWTTSRSSADIRVMSAPVSRSDSDV